MTPNQNAQKYFHRYQKLKNAVKLIGEQIQEAKDEIQYLESVLSQLEIAGPMDIEAIKEELTSEGYLKKKNLKNKNVRNHLSLINTFLLTERSFLLVKTIFKMTSWQWRQLKNRLLASCKNIPGSHVIIKSDKPSDETITEAAELAAYFSKYRYSAQVPVDLVQVKHIRKPNGAKPGYVIYENQKTIIVTPEEEKITAMKQNR